MTGSITTESIRSALKNVGLTKIDKDVLSKCVALASAQDISPSDMAECWEVLSMNARYKELTLHTFEAYRSQLLKSCCGVSAGAIQTRKVKREQPQTVTPPTAKRGKHNDNKNTSSSSVDSVARNDLHSPDRSKKTTPAFPTNIVKYDQRTDAGTVMATFAAEGIKPTTPKTIEDVPRDARCVISTDDFQDSNVTKSYRHMFSTMTDRAAALEKHLVEMGNEIIQTYGISNGENGIAPLEQVNVPRQDKVCCVGRICNEAHSGKLNKTTVVLEGSSAKCGGARINVDLTPFSDPAAVKQPQQQQHSYSIFPGQIVAVEGINLTGRKLVAQRICEGAAHPANSTPARKLLDYHAKQGGAPLKIVSASGPFTTSDSLEYQPLIDLVSGFMEDVPDAVILTGPFVDARQEKIQSGRVFSEREDGSHVVASYEAFFANKISALLKELFQSDVPTQFILIPSLDDTVAKGVYPQPPLQDNKSLFETMDLSVLENTGKPGRVHCLSNPCTFKINEVVFGVTSTDVLFHMSTEEIHHNLPPNTRLRRIAQHVLQQRSYYPVFPPPAHSPSTNLDLKHLDQWKLPCRPDVLILPSKLKAMANTVLDSTVVVNPGNLTRAASGGTYAVMEIHPIKREKLDEAGDDVCFPHAVHERIHVTVKRI